MVILKTRPFVKWNNTEFTNVSSFTSHLMCSTHFTLSCRILPFSLPTTNNFFKFVYSEITRESAWQVLFRPPWCCLLLWQLKVIRIGLATILDFWYPGRSYLVQDVIVHYFFYIFSVLYTKKMHWREHSLADTVPLFFFDHFIPPFVYNCCVIHTSLVIPHLHHYITIPPERWLPLFQALAFPFLGHMECPCSLC